MIPRNIQVQAVLIVFGISVTTAGMPNKVLGGSTATVGEFPHQVSLRYRNFHICGGSIISRFHILTSASCVLLDTESILANIKVLSGTNDQLNTDGTGLIHDISIITFHEDYNPQNHWINDIAILTLDLPLSFSRVCQPISLPLSVSRYYEVLHGIGWGNALRFVDYALPNINKYLQKLDMVIVTPKRCTIIFSGRRVLHKNQICAGGSSDSYLTKGDGGNALTVRNEIIGIASISGSFYRSTVIYTDVYRYVDWINSVINA